MPTLPAWLFWPLEVCLQEGQAIFNTTAIGGNTSQHFLCSAEQRWHKDRAQVALAGRWL